MERHAGAAGARAGAIDRQIAHTIQLSGKALSAITAGLIIIAGIDVPYQLWTYAKQMKMSRQEIREEHKESEGSPEVKDAFASCSSRWLASA